MPDQNQAKLESEASQYEESDLLKHIEKREKNVKIFEDAIEKEQIEIDREKQMLTIIRIKNRR